MHFVNRKSFRLFYNAEPNPPQSLPVNAGGRTSARGGGAGEKADLFRASFSYICTMKIITLEVSDEIAKKFGRLSIEEKQSTIKTLARLLDDKRTLFQVMDDISEYARKQGMTPEILEEILKKDK